MPTVSIIMPAYNVQDFIRPAVHSIQAQTYTDWELIAVDDASTDRTYDYLLELAQSDTRIKVSRLPANQGTWAARNKAIGEARGQWLCLMDADDISHPERLRLCSSFFTDAEVKVIHTDCWYGLDPDLNRPKSASTYIPPYEKLGASMVLPRVLLGKVAGPSAFFRRELLTGKMTYRRCRIEDADLMLRLLSDIREAYVIHVRADLYGCRISAGQKTKNRVATDLGSINLMAHTMFGPRYKLNERFIAVLRMALQTMMLFYHLAGFSGHPFRRRK